MVGARGDRELLRAAYADPMPTQKHQEQNDRHGGNQHAEARGGGLPLQLQLADSGFAAQQVDLPRGLIGIEAILQGRNLAALPLVGDYGTEARHFALGLERTAVIATHFGQLHALLGKFALQVEAFCRNGGFDFLQQCLRLIVALQDSRGRGETQQRVDRAEPVADLASQRERALVVRQRLHGLPEPDQGEPDVVFSPL